MSTTLSLTEETYKTIDNDPAPPRGKGVFTRRARLTVCLALVGFVAMQAGLRMAIDVWRPELRDPTFEIKYRQLARAVSTHRQPPAVVLFLGSSLTANGMKADMVEAPLASSLGRPVVSYNLATYGAGPFTQLLYVQRLLRRGMRPDMVVLELSPMGFDASESAFDINRSPAHLLEYPDLDTVQRHSGQADLHAEWWKSRLVPAYGHRQMILNATAHLLIPFKDHVQRWEEADDHGWFGRDPTAPEDYPRVMREIEERYKSRLGAYKMYPAPVQALRELSDILAKEKVVTIPVVMPVGYPMNSFYPPGGTEPLMNEFRTICATHGFTLIDASTWMGDDKFRDSYHLHRQGAQEFTARLVNEVIAPSGK